jgi:ribosomal protein L37AE/L43A
MKIRVCPRCQQEMLIPTGAFWTCYACSFAITGQALTVTLASEADQGRNKNRQGH